MNNERRKQIKAVIKNLAQVADLEDKTKINDILEDATNAIEGIKGDEQDAFDNLTEGLQSARQESHDEVISCLEEALGFIEDVDADEEDFDELDVEECITKLLEIN